MAIDFGQWMVKTRGDKGVSLDALAPKVPTSKSHLWQIEHGTTPRLDSAAKIAKALGVPLWQAVKAMGESRGKPRELVPAPGKRTKRSKPAAVAAVAPRKRSKPASKPTKPAAKRPVVVVAPDKPKRSHKRKTPPAVVPAAVPLGLAGEQ